jgi:hypothetical protein
MRQPWLYFCYGFDASIVNSFSLSILHVSCYSVFNEDLKVYNDSVFADDLWISHDIAFSTIPCITMNLFLLLNACVGREFIYSIDSIRSCHSIFIDDFKVYSESVFADDLWISRDIAFLPIPCVSHDSSFAIDLIRRSWIHWLCRIQTSPVTQYAMTISRSTPTKFLLTIYGSVVTSCFFTIPYVSHDTIFTINLLRRSWIHWLCGFHTSAVTQFLVTISRSTATLFFADNV